MVGRLANNELERMWKEVIMAQFEILSWHLHGGTERNRENYCQDSQFLGQDLNLEPPVYRAGVLPT
jgi:hypothetical protein